MGRRCYSAPSPLARSGSTSPSPAYSPRTSDCPDGSTPGPSSPPQCGHLAGDSLTCVDCVGLPRTVLRSLVMKGSAVRIRASAFLRTRTGDGFRPYRLSTCQPLTPKAATLDNIAILVPGAREGLRTLRPSDRSGRDTMGRSVGAAATPRRAARLVGAPEFGPPASQDSSNCSGADNFGGTRAWERRLVGASRPKRPSQRRQPPNPGRRCAAAEARYRA